MFGILGKQPHLGCTRPKFGERYPVEERKMLGILVYTRNLKKVLTIFPVATRFEKELFWFGILNEKEKSLEMLNYQLDTQFQVYF